jgi:hypothetical protein
VAAALAGHQRLALQELWTGLTPRERLLAGMMIGGIFAAPALFEGPTIWREGLLWPVPVLMLLAVTPASARAWLAWTLAAAWVGALVAGPAAVGMILVLVFGATWLLALGAAYFAFTGDPYGLPGWWAARRLILGVTGAVLPAAGIAATVWILWPPSGLHPSIAPVPAGDQVLSPAEARSRLTQQIDPLELASLLWDGLVALVLIFLLFCFMLLMRRLLKRSKPGRFAPDVLPGQAARLEYRPRPARRRPRLDGLRGQIVALWGLWAKSMGQEGLGPNPAETAREHAGRLDRQSPQATPPSEMTALLEQAHYGPLEPTRQDVTQMRRLIEEELSRQSLRLSIGAPPLDPE